MKKLLLILSAIFVSVMSWAVDPNTGWKHSNPFAYGLTARVSDDQSKVYLTYSLNANAVNHTDLNSSLGVQIRIINKETNATVKTIADGSIGITRGTHTVEVSTDGLPRDTELTFEMIVNGNKNRTSPQIIGSASKNPVNAHGIGINTDPTHQNFGQIFVSEAYPSTTDNHNSLLEFDPQLQYVKRHVKQTHIVSSTETSTTSYFSGALNYEPHRVKTTTDGRVFVTCYHPTAGGAVLEYLGNNTFKNVIAFDKTVNKGSDTNTELYRRVIGMDVKGEGADLKIVVAWIDANGYTFTNSLPGAKIMVYEYDLGKAEAANATIPLPQVIGTDITSTYVRKIGEENDWRSASDKSGLLYQGFTGLWNSCLRGFVDVAYGKNNDVWMKIDYGSYATHPGRIILFRGNAKITEVLGNNTSVSGSYDDYFGGNALIYDVYKDGTQTLVAGFSNGYIKGHSIGIADDATTKPNTMFSGKWQVSNTDSNSANRIGYWVTAFAKDYAGNLYALTERREDYAGSTASDNSFNANILCIALPYSGQRVTRANSTFIISDPIPNILATDLRFAPDGNSDRYVFSFNVNTTPQVAQIRFYKSYGDDGENDMKKNLAKINADDYQGEDSITPSFVYDIPTNQLKQGKISVSLGMCGGIIEDGKITNGKLPRGEWYWSVYVEAPRKSSVFAPIYRLVGQTHATEGYERKHATVNNYPETDGFGNIIVAHNPQNTTNDATRPEKGLRIYGISNSGNDEHAYTNTDRYSLRATYLNKNSTTGMLNYPRRMDVAPDGKVYIADEGSPTDKNWKDVANGPVIHVRGGVKVWDPAIPNNFTLFSDNKILTATSVALWDGKLYATNTYDEYVKHLNGKTNYTKAQQENTSQYGWNGFVGYVLNKYTSPGNWNSWSGNKTDYALGRGDAAGNIALVAMDKGVWMCQHKEHNRAVKDATYQPLADNLDGYILSFVPYGSNTRTWTSCVENGVDNFDTPGSRTERADASDFSQKLNSPVQSTPGGGIAYKKVNGKEYLYVVNHDGNIAQLEITSWSGSGTTAKPTIPIANIKILTTPTETKGTKEASAGGYSTTWTGAYITSMTFDYAGNLVTTTGKNYHDGPQDIVVYTMPYDRVNAREIQAPNSCRYIPERVSHMDMGNQELANIINYYLESNSECYVDIFRPMFNTAFNTICLPFDVNLSQATAGAYHNATLMQFDKAVVTEVNNEKMLELQFTEKTDKIIEAGIPYLIKPENPIPGIMSLEQDIKFETITSTNQTRTFNNGNNSITFIGIIPYQFINVTNQPLPLIVVDQNRLAEVSNGGNILGFRAYFQLAKELDPGTKVGISARKPTPTNVITIDGKRVNIEKFLREGRVYIRVGDSLYTISGEKVE